MSQTDQARLNVPNPEVVTKTERRHFTAEYKQRVLLETDACNQRGEIGALLRREGLCSSHLDTWRRQRTRGVLQGLTPAKRGRKADPQAAENARLLREMERLKAQLERAELIIGVQKSFVTTQLTRDSERRTQMISTTEKLGPTLGLQTACDISQVARSSVYRASHSSCTLTFLDYQSD